MNSKKNRIHTEHVGYPKQFKKIKLNGPPSNIPSKFLSKLDERNAGTTI